MVFNARVPDTSSHPLLQYTKSIGLPAGDYVIFGSAPMLLHGLRDEISDVDIVARGLAWDVACSKGQPVRASLNGASAVQFLDGRIEVFTTWVGREWDINALIDNAEIIGSLPFARLSDVLTYKLDLYRAKDIADIQAISSFLMTIERSGAECTPTPTAA